MLLPPMEHADRVVELYSDLDIETSYSVRPSALGMVVGASGRVAPRRCTEVQV